jgi:hypothetical protein
VNPLSLNLATPEDLIADFASAPDSQFNRIAICSADKSWPLYEELSRFLNSLPRVALELTYSDATFLGLHGRDERKARIWFADRLFTDEVSRRRLSQLANSGTLPYPHPALGNVPIDAEGMVKLSEFDYDGSRLSINGFSFVTCLINKNFNSTHWLQQCWFDQGISDHVSVRLDPFLWGPSDSFATMFFKMLVYAKPLDWDDIGKLKVQRHGRWTGENSLTRTELTDFCWSPRDDGIHFVCEELPRKDRINAEAAR